MSAPKRGRPADPERPQRILEALRPSRLAFDQSGAAINTVAAIAERICMDESDLRKALRALVASGLVVAEQQNMQVFNGIAQANRPRQCWTYWLGASAEADQATIRAWHAGHALKSTEPLRVTFNFS